MINIEQSILENLRELPTEKQQEVLDFTEFLRQKTQPSSPESLINKTQLTPKEKSERWRKFIASLPQESANLPDEALHRDTMYEE